jgi:hypothetical protein
VGVNYHIEVFHHGQDDQLAKLREAVASELRAVGLHRAVTVAIEASPASPTVPAAGVYLGDVAAATDPNVVLKISRALADGVLVLPVVKDLAHFARDVPALLAPLNGVQWQSDADAHRLARILLAELGIEERQRRAFISHKREDGLGAAEQLHDALAHDRFVPFIDRFVIPYGAPVQRTIADALEDHAFLLLIETPLAHTSEWVFDEVEYALAHAMGVLIVTWPGKVEPVPGSGSLPRLVLDPADLTTDAHGFEILTATALARVIVAAERAHADGLVRRRRNLVTSVEDAARRGGATAVPLPGWRLLVEHAGTTTVVGVTPRLPTAEDLQHLDTARATVAKGADALLVHAARTLTTDRLAHLMWAVCGRSLELTPENAVGGRW